MFTLKCLICNQQLQSYIYVETHRLDWRSRLWDMCYICYSFERHFCVCVWGGGGSDHIKYHAIFASKMKKNHHNCDIWYRIESQLYIENTRWVSFDIKFTRHGFENTCWHHEACRAVQHGFSKPSLVNLISKDANLVFYLSVYQLLNTLQTSDYDVFFNFVLI